MKRALQANINNKVFYIDEDAYDLLQNYLRQLGDAFSGPEGREIVSDIESRTSELLSEKVEGGKNVIDIQCIYNVIDIIGRPEELGEMAAGGVSEYAEQPTPPPYKEPKQTKKLYRDPNNKVLGGVVGGLAKYLGWDAGVMRVLLVILAITTYVMPVFICYLIAWMVIPVANTPRKKLEMEGREVTFDSVMKSLRDSTQEQLGKFDSHNVGQAATSLLGVIFKVAAGLIVLVALAICFASIIGLFVAIFIPYTGIAHDMFGYREFMPYLCTWYACIFLAISIVMGVIAWGVGSMAFTWKSLSKSLMLTLGIILAMVIAVLIVLSIYFVNAHINPIDPF